MNTDIKTHLDTMKTAIIIVHQVAYFLNSVNDISNRVVIMFSSYITIYNMGIAAVGKVVIPSVQYCLQNT